MTRRFRRPEREQVRAIDIGGRVPPHDLEAEATALASVFADGRRFDELAGIVSAEHFYADANRRVFEAMSDLRSRSQPVDLQTVASWLKDREWLEAIGGISYLAKLTDSTPVVAHLTAYATKIRGKANRRRLLDVAQLIVAEAHVWTGEDSDLFEHAARNFAEVFDAATPVENVTLAAAVDERMSEIRDVWGGELDPAGMQTRFGSFNAITGGLFPAQLHVVSALTSGGKSAFAWEMCLDVAGTEFRDEIVGCVAVSAEMLRGELVDRGLALEGPERRRYLKKDPTADVITATEGAAHTLRGKPVVIVDRAVTLEEIRASVRGAQRTFDRARRPGEKRTRVRFVLVDYLQILKLPNEKDLRVAVGIVTTALKRLAQELGVHVVLVSQLVREVGKGMRRPTVFDLKESGSIENDSDLITFIHRPVETVEVEERRSDDWQALEDYAEIVIGKQRGGVRGKYVPVGFDGAHTRFDEPTERQRDKWRAAMAALKSKAAPPAPQRRNPYPS